MSTFDNPIYSYTRFLRKPDYEFIALVETTSQSRSETDFKSRHMFCVQAFETNHQLKLMLNLKLTQSHRISSGTISMIRGKNDLYNISYDLFVMCGMLTLPCAS